MPSADSAFSLIDTEPRPAAPARRGKTTGGRYGRWHLETSVASDDDGWLLTYLDVITLMLVMMVVMLSVAGPAGDKGGQGVPDTTAPPPDPLATTVTTAVQKPTLAPPLPVTTAAATSQADPVDAPPTPAPPSPDPWAGLQLDQIGQDIAVIPGQDSLRFRISNELLFASGEAQLVNGGQVMLDKLLPTLMADPGLRLVVEGHTDSVPIQTARYPSNWELSTGRAASVARYLIERGVAPQRVQASGYADTRPMGGKDNPMDRVVNRRVELVLEKVPPGR